MDGSTGGLMYYGARYYLPELKRFISADTIVPSTYDSQALNRYAYVMNNPVKLVDPSGHFAMPVRQPMIDNTYGIGYRPPQPVDDPSTGEETESGNIDDELNSNNPAHGGNNAGGNQDGQFNAIVTPSMFIENTQNAWNIVTHPHEVFELESGFGYYYLAGAWLAWEGFGVTALVAGLGMFTYEGIAAIAGAISPVATAACADGVCSNEIEAVSSTITNSEPFPPGWTEGWQRLPSTRQNEGMHWWDLDMGEWHWHPADTWHESHWDYNPWDSWNSPWLRFLSDSQ